MYTNINILCNKCSNTFIKFCILHYNTWNAITNNSWIIKNICAYVNFKERERTHPDGWHDIDCHFTLGSPIISSLNLCPFPVRQSMHRPLKTVRVVSHNCHPSLQCHEVNIAVILQAIGWLGRSRGLEFERRWRTAIPTSFKFETSCILIHS